MRKNDSYIFVTQDKLADFSRYNIGLTDILNTDLDDITQLEPDVFEFENDYPMMLDDLKTALETFKDEKTDVYEFLLNWWYPVLLYFYDSLCLDEVMGPDSNLIGMLEVPDFPMTEEDLIATIFNVIGKSVGNPTFPKNAVALSSVLDIDSMIEMIEFFSEDRDLPVEERRFTTAQKIAFINHWNNDLMLEDAPDYIKSMFRKFTDELAAEGNFDAIKVKAYSLYGGNSVYPCDYVESSRLLEILWKKYSFGYAADTLGYIHYYGRIDGRPDYEKAFFYFSVASAYNITEARYKLADMFLNGYYVAPNPPMAYQTYIKLYNETRYYFEDGDYSCDFADCALRMDKVLSLIPIQRVHRYKVLLEAKYAIEKRIKYNKEIGDDTVLATIKDRLAKAKEEIMSDPAFNYGSRTQPLGSNNTTEPIEEFVNSFKTAYTMIIKRIGNRFKVSIHRMPQVFGGKPQLSLSTQPWVDFTGLVSKFDFTVDAGENTQFLDFLIEHKGGKIEFDAMTVSDPIEMSDLTSFSFYSHGKLVCMFTADRLFFNKPKDESEN
ncbi:MAG: hypothetical protein K6F45_07895 [Saccharofermentans sp.]|nr:hypothetical protein [Saccharofermentans sp.]